ncbi:hypothetical protein IAT38_004951 [Cryptococcus sp. DSM 104549]
MAGKDFRFRVRAGNKPLHVPCAPELTALLACFASTGDLRHTAACAEAAKGLHTCMTVTKPAGKVPKSSINYLLSKLRK